MRGLTKSVSNVIYGFTFAFVSLLFSVALLGVATGCLLLGYETTGIIVAWFSFIILFAVATICLFATEYALRQLNPTPLDDENVYKAASTNTARSTQLEFEFTADQ